MLQAYLDKILPELQYTPLSKTLEIRDGINIMDLERFKEETQTIIIKSILEEVLTKEKNTLIIIPECWKYLPEKYGSPVKRPAEAFIRQGATNNNFLILDSQDITGISKAVLKQVSCWVLGYQREINEISRTLDQIPLPKNSKPKSEDIATLKVAQFFVATSEFVKKCYAQPIWLNDKTAEKVARGEIKVSELEQPLHIAPYQIVPKLRENANESIVDNKKINELREDFISNRNDFFNKFQQINETISAIHSELYKSKSIQINEDEIVMRVLQKVPVANPNFDKEAVVREVLARVPKGGSVTYEVAPLEKIKKDFLDETKQTVLSVISNLNEKQKKMLKWIEQNGKNTKKNEIFLNCFGKSATGGGAYTELGKQVLEMKNLEIIRVDTQQRIFPYLKDKLKNMLQQYGATEQEIEQVYNHILAEILK